MSSVAVIIPLFNHAHYIPAAMESVYAQKLAPRRVIIIDDGSTDDSFAVAKNLARPGTQVIRQKNCGAHSTLNRGIEMADDCEWVAILNSDDAWHPERLLRCHETLLKTPAKEIICTGLHLMDADSSRLDDSSPKMRRNLKVWELVKKTNDPLLSLAVSNFAKTTSNIFASRRFLLTHPFGNYRYVHDYHFLLQAAFADKLAVLSDDLLSYRVHDTNTIKADGRRAVVAETLQMHLDLFGTLSDALQKSSHLRSHARLYLQRLFGNHTDFRAELLIQLLCNAIASKPMLFDVDSLGNLVEFESKSEPLP